MTPVYLVRSPAGRIIKCDAELVMRKLGWAQVKGRRYLLGTSAFFSAPAARRVKLARLIKAAKVQFVAIRYPHLMRDVRDQLADPNHKGWTVLER